jgi:hypothetical protein
LRVRLGWVAAGLVGALAVRWFVPTTDGVSLWGATRLASETEAIPVDDLDRYRSEEGRRQTAIRRFPGLETEIADAERAWLRRRVDAAIQDADRLLPADPIQASESLRKLAGDLAKLDHWKDVRDVLREARQRTVRGAVNAVGAELKAQLDRGDPAGVADTARRLVDGPDGLDAKAGEVGLEDDARRGLTELRARAVQVRLKAAEERLGPAAARGEYTAVRDGARKADAELAGEAKVAGVGAEVSARLWAVRRQAVRACLDAARREVATLLAKDRFQAIAALGERLGNVLRQEAEAVGSGGDLDQFRQACQTFGDLARQAGRADPK